MSIVALGFSLLYMTPTVCWDVIMGREEVEMSLPTMSKQKDFEGFRAH